MIDPPLKGRLLVARPALSDPNFFRTVVLVLEHGEEGALGVILNRPSELEVLEPLPRWSPLAADPPVVFFGGPVARDAAICLGRLRHDDGVEGWQQVIGAVGVLDLNKDPDDLAGRVEAIRVFVGYGGWGAGQLEAEIAAGGWIVLDADPDDAMSPVPDKLWRDVLRRQGGDHAVLANFPLDPSLN